MFQAKQKAAALITAIMITAVVATLSTAIMVSQSLFINEAQIIQANSQYYLGVSGMVNQAKALLLATWQKNNGKIYAINASLPKVTDGPVHIQGRIEDAEGFYNINALTSSNAIPGFATLIHYADKNVDAHAAMRIANKTYSWVQSSDAIGDYGENQPPYQPEHRPMTLAKEWRLVDGVSATVMQAVYPYLIALPKKVKVNVNSASAPVFLALLPKKYARMKYANAIVACRKQHEVFKTNKMFASCFKSGVLQSVQLNSQSITLSSHYFFLSLKATTHGRSYSSMILLYLKPSDQVQQGAKVLYWPRVEVLWQQW